MRGNSVPVTDQASDKEIFGITEILSAWLYYVNIEAGDIGRMLPLADVLLARTQLAARYLAVLLDRIFAGA
jgi:hypothetical protein